MPVWLALYTTRPQFFCSDARFVAYFNNSIGLWPSGFRGVTFSASPSARATGAEAPRTARNPAGRARDLPGAEVALSVSYLELVNEELRDLLQPKEEREALRVPPNAGLRVGWCGVCFGWC